MDAELREYVARREGVISGVRRILIDNLHVQLEEDAIDLDAALFGTGLGLDSVDALELVVAAEGIFGVTFPQDTLRASLRTVNAVVDLVLVLQTPEQAS